MWSFTTFVANPKRLYNKVLERHTVFVKIGNLLSTVRDFARKKVLAKNGLKIARQEPFCRQVQKNLSVTCSRHKNT